MPYNHCNTLLESTVNHPWSKLLPVPLAPAPAKVCRYIYYIHRDTHVSFRGNFSPIAFLKRFNAVPVETCALTYNVITLYTPTIHVHASAACRPLLSML